MWRRLLSSPLKSLKSLPSSSTPASAPSGCISKATRLGAASHVSPSPAVSLFARHYASDSADTGLKKVEDVMPIATGHEREDLEASLEGKDILDINHPVGPFRTKVVPRLNYQHVMRYSTTVPNEPDTHDDFKPTNKLESSGLSLRDVVEQMYL